MSETGRSCRRCMQAEAKRKLLFFNAGRKHPGKLASGRRLLCPAGCFQHPARCRSQGGQRFAVGVFAVVLLLLCAVSRQAKAAEPPRRRIVLVVCDRLTWEDVNASCPFLVSQMDHSALGLMNTTVPGLQNATAAALTLALGRAATAEPDDEQAFDTTESVAGLSATAGQVYARRTGEPAPLGRTIVHLNTVSLAQRQVLGHNLGTALATAMPPRRLLIVGNSDTDRPARRGGAARPGWTGNGRRRARVGRAGQDGQALWSA